jgi:hypothetical protein
VTKSNAGPGPFDDAYASKVSILRHRDINDFTAQGILADLADEREKDWWK